MKYDKSLLTFNPRNHGHYLEGKRLLGVTTALSAISKGDGLIQWAVNCACDYTRDNAPAILDGTDSASDQFQMMLTGAKYAWKQARQEAASIGSIAHNWIEAYLKGLDPDWPEHDGAKRSCEAALEWIRSVKWENIRVEHQICIPELQVAGICDWYVCVDGVLAVADWKTSKSLHSTYAYQTAAYLRALEDEFDVEIPNRWLIRIDKETGALEPRLLTRDTLERDYKAFESAVNIYRAEAEIKKEWLNLESTQ